MFENCQPDGGFEDSWVPGSNECGWDAIVLVVGEIVCSSSVIANMRIG